MHQAIRDEVRRIVGRNMEPIHIPLGATSPSNWLLDSGWLHPFGLPSRAVPDTPRYALSSQTARWAMPSSID